MEELGQELLSRVRRGVSTILNHGDRQFLERSMSPDAFAQSLARELSFAGYCTPEEYRDVVRPFLRDQKERLRLLRAAVLAGLTLRPSKLLLSMTEVLHRVRAAGVSIDRGSRIGDLLPACDSFLLFPGGRGTRKRRQARTARTR